MRRFASIVMAVATTALGSTACDPPPPPANVVTIVGDSLTMTTLLDGHLPGYDVHSMLGWQAEDAQPGLDQRVADPARSPRTVVIVLGQNDAADHTDPTLIGDGWTTTDAQQVTRLANTPHPDATVCWILPAYYGTDPAYAAGITRFRQWLTAFAAGRGEHVADWATVARPEYIGADGVHLTPTGRAAYGQLITQEATRCG